MNFDQLIHRPPGLRQLRQMAAADRLPHANLLLAPPGSGGLPAALAVANLLLCENRQGEHGDTACGKCRACRKTSRFVHPDFHFAFPTIGSKMTSDPFLPQWREALGERPYQEANDWLQRIGAENKQGNITREACANILKKLNLKIFEGRYKIMLIWLPEYLGNEGNRLLKMIEEPPKTPFSFWWRKGQNSF
jgi:DNA polymerase-3 subunit delta'